VTARGDLVVLDTNVLVHLVRGRAIGRALDHRYGLSTAVIRPLICIVTVGECLAIARCNDWGLQKRGSLQDLLRELVVVDLSDARVLDAYAELDAFMRARGNKMGKNDLWIGAVTRSQGAWLLTLDADFLPACPELIEVEHVDPRSLLPEV
jgi:tRNA(fMet)-specific endonuclease VapC